MVWQYPDDAGGKSFAFPRTTYYNINSPPRALYNFLRRAAVSAAPAHARTSYNYVLMLRTWTAAVMVRGLPPLACTF